MSRTLPSSAIGSSSVCPSCGARRLLSAREIAARRGGVDSSRQVVNVNGDADLLPMKSGGFGSFVTGDVDNDGKQDLLATAGSNGLYIFRQLKRR